MIQLQSLREQVSPKGKKILLHYFCYRLCLVKNNNNTLYSELFFIYKKNSVFNFSQQRGNSKLDDARNVAGLLLLLLPLLHPTHEKNSFFMDGNEKKRSGTGMPKSFHI